MKKTKLTFNSNFERYEIKFYLNPTQLRNFISLLDAYMTLDQYGLHTICTLYYDTPDFYYIRHSLSHPSFKQKLRVRSYGVPTIDKLSFLELKKKVAGITYKRRVGLPLKNITNYLENPVQPLGNEMNWQEINWFCQQNVLVPKITISYDRLAYFGNEDENFRVTFDQNIRWREQYLALNNGDFGYRLLDQGITLMEVKTMNALPLWFCKLLNSQQLYPIKCSKYGFAYGQLMQGRRVMANVS